MEFLRGYAGVVFFGDGADLGDSEAEEAVVFAVAAFAGGEVTFQELGAFWLA